MCFPSNSTCLTQLLMLNGITGQAIAYGGVCVKKRVSYITSGSLRSQDGYKYSSIAPTYAYDDVPSVTCVRLLSDTNNTEHYRCTFISHHASFVSDSHAHKVKMSFHPLTDGSFSLVYYYYVTDFRVN